MAASAESLSLKELNPTEGWTFVLPRRGKHRRNLMKVRTVEDQQQPWVPSDLIADPERESKLMKKMQIYMNKVESSQFYCTFMDQLQNPQISDCICRVLGSEPKMQMVIYGVGSIESYEPPRLQLSLAILMKRKFSWIGEIEVFDPIMSATESRVLEALGCSVLSVNEQGRRQALKPTLFFMPHCEAELYDNLLQANWRLDLLNHVVLFGNSFETYEHHVAVFKNARLNDMRKHILRVRRFVKEFGIKTDTDDYFRAFNGSSWHFFSPVTETELQPINFVMELFLTWIEDCFLKPKFRSCFSHFLRILHGIFSPKAIECKQILF